MIIFKNKDIPGVIAKISSVLASKISISLILDWVEMVLDML